MNKVEKKEAATLFAESARLEYLRKLGKSRSDDEQREFSRLYQKSRRQDQRRILRGEESPYDKFATAKEFWQANRLTLSKKKLDELLEVQELVLDQEHWLQHGFELDPNDQDFVSLEEGLSDLNAFIEERGLVHDHPTSYHSSLLRHYTPYFGVWSPRDLYYPPYGRVPAFFKNTEVLDALCTEESTATEIYARYGIKTGLSSWDVLLFKRRIANHATGSDEHRLMIGKNRWKVSGCWLCEFEAAERKRNQATAEGDQPQGIVVSPTPSA